MKEEGNQGQAAGQPTAPAPATTPVPTPAIIPVPVPVPVPADATAAALAIAAAAVAGADAYLANNSLKGATVTVVGNHSIHDGEGAGAHAPAAELAAVAPAPGHVAATPATRSTVTLAALWASAGTHKPHAK